MNEKINIHYKPNSPTNYKYLLISFNMKYILSSYSDYLLFCFCEDPLWLRCIINSTIKYSNLEEIFKFYYDFVQ